MLFLGTRRPPKVGKMYYHTWLLFRYISMLNITSFIFFRPFKKIRDRVDANYNDIDISFFLYRSVRCGLNITVKAIISIQHIIHQRTYMYILDIKWLYINIIFITILNTKYRLFQIYLFSYQLEMLCYVWTKCSLVHSVRINTLYCNNVTCFVP